MTVLSLAQLRQIRKRFQKWFYGCLSQSKGQRVCFVLPSSQNVCPSNFSGSSHARFSHDTFVLEDSWQCLFSFGELLSCCVGRWRLNCIRKNFFKNFCKNFFSPNLSDLIIPACKRDCARTVELVCLPKR